MYLPEHPLNTVQDLIASFTGGCLFLDTVAKKTAKTTTKHNNFRCCHSIVKCYTWRIMIMNENKHGRLATTA